MLGDATTDPGSPSSAKMPRLPMLSKIRARAVTFSATIQFVRVTLNWQWMIENDAISDRRIRTLFIVEAESFMTSDVKCRNGGCEKVGCREFLPDESLFLCGFENKLFSRETSPINDSDFATIQIELKRNS